MEHRVEPPSWLPQGAAHEAPGGEPDQATAPTEEPADEAPRAYGRSEDPAVPAKGLPAEGLPAEGVAARGVPVPVPGLPAEGVPAQGPADEPSRSVFQRDRDDDITVSARRPAEKPRPSVFRRGDEPTVPPEKPAADTPYDYGQDTKYTYRYDGGYTDSQNSSYEVPEPAADPGYSPEPGRQDRAEPQVPEFGGGFRAGVAAPPGGSGQAGRAGFRGPGPVGPGDPMGGSAAVGATAAGSAVQAGRRPAVAGSSVYTPRAAVPKPKPATQARRANLVIARIEPWSVMKFSFLISLVSWLVLFVAVTILYYALSGLGVFDAIQRTLSSVTSSQGSGGVDLSRWTSASRVLGYTMLIGAVNVILITALATVGSVIYNLVTHLGGGVEVTLKEAE